MTIKHIAECDQCGVVDAYGTDSEDAAKRHERTCPTGGTVWSVRRASANVAVP